MWNTNEKLIEILQHKKDPVWEELSPDEKIKNFFNKLEFLRLEPEEKAQVAQKIKNDANLDKLYWWEIILSAGIATLGLLQNSVAVIIWAMLIAPLLRPINWIAYSIATWERTFFKKSIFMLILSIILAIGLWYFITKILNLEIQTPEILGRTNPTLLDLFVASLSAIVAILSLKFTRLGESVAGVAMAASLMPPLAVVGIQLAFGNLSASWWAFMLFLTNLVAIILVGVILFWMYGFNPHKLDQHKKVMKRLAFVIIGLIVITVPLVHSLQVIKEKNNLKKIIQQNVEQTLSNKISNFKIQDIQIKNLTDKKIDVNLTLSLPENVNFYKTFKNELTYNLSHQLWKNINLNIELIRTANIISQKFNDIAPQIEHQINQVFTKYPSIQLINFSIQKIQDKEYILKLVIATNNQNLDKLKKEIEKQIQQNIKAKLGFIWIVVPQYQAKPQSKEKEIYSKLSYKWEAFLNQILTDWIYFKNLQLNFNLSWDKVQNLNTFFDLYIPTSLWSWELNLLYNQIKKFNQDISGNNLNIRQFRYKERKF